METIRETRPVGASVDRRSVAQRQAERWVPLLGRALLAAIFIVSGLAKIADFGGSLGYMQAQGMPAAEVFLVLAIVVELACGAGLLLGASARVSATVLALYLIPVTLIFHPFWAYTGMEQRMQLVNFLKNLAIMGGLAFVATYGPGLLSITARRRRNELVERRPMAAPIGN
jgi:putative oxidoreductase